MESAAELLTIYNFFRPREPNETTVLGGEWTELNQIWAEHKWIIGAPDILLDFRHIAPFLNANDSNGTEVENRGQ